MSGGDVESFDFTEIDRTVAQGLCCPASSGAAE